MSNSGNLLGPWASPPTAAASPSTVAAASLPTAVQQPFVFPPFVFPTTSPSTDKPFIPDFVKDAVRLLGGWNVVQSIGISKATWAAGLLGSYHKVVPDLVPNLAAKRQMVWFSGAAQLELLELDAGVIRSLEEAVNLIVGGKWNVERGRTTIGPRFVSNHIPKDPLRQLALLGEVPPPDKRMGTYSPTSVRKLKQLLEPALGEGCIKVEPVMAFSPEECRVWRALFWAALSRPGTPFPPGWSGEEVLGGDKTPPDYIPDEYRIGVRALLPKRTPHWLMRELDKPLLAGPVFKRLDYGSYDTLANGGVTRAHIVTLLRLLDHPGPGIHPFLLKMLYGPSLCHKYDKVFFLRMVQAWTYGTKRVDLKVRNVAGYWLRTLAIRYRKACTLRFMHACKGANLVVEV